LLLVPETLNPSSSQKAVQPLPAADCRAACCEICLLLHASHSRGLAFNAQPPQDSKVLTFDL